MEVLKAIWNEGEEADKAEASLRDWINSQILDFDAAFVFLCEGEALRATVAYGSRSKRNRV
jgi:hypothetical protein